VVLLIRYSLYRIASAIPVLLGVSIIVFLLVQFIPIDPAKTILGGDATPEAIAALREKMGLNDPLFLQYVTWLQKILHGNLGDSFSLHKPIANELIPKFLNTVILAGASLLICMVIGVLLGIWSAMRQGGAFDKISMVFALIGASMPVFWVALMLMWFFGIEMKWLPVSGMYDLRNPGGTVDLLKHLILPAIATALVSTAVIARLARSTVLDVLQKDYIRFFQSFGLNTYHVTVWHILRNSLVPIINITGLQFGYLMGGALFSEVVFNWPGVGLQLYKAITANDYPMVQAGVLLIAATFVLVNVFVDVLNTFLNPKLRDSTKSST
jgi:peptide/nickel transport system permease protein